MRELFPEPVTLYLLDHVTSLLATPRGKLE